MLNEHMNGMWIGLLEYDGSMNPTVIVGVSQLAVLREGVRQVSHTDEDGKTGLIVGDDAWLAAHPFPDMHDAFAIAAWLKAVHNRFPDDITWTIYAPPSGPPLPGILAGVMEPDDAKWVQAKPSTLDDILDDLLRP